MNATRAATIRLRSSFDGAVSLGRVQTPTLAILARREEEIRAFVPEPYWLVDAHFEAPAARPAARYGGRFHAGAQPRLKTAAEAEAVVAAVRGRPARSPSSRRRPSKEKRAAPLRPHVAAARRQHRFGFCARRTLAAAQRLYEEHKALTYPRTSSRYLTATWSGDQADRRARRPPPRVREGRRLRHRPRRPAARPGGQRREGHRPPRDHPDQRSEHNSTR